MSSPAAATSDAAQRRPQLAEARLGVGALGARDRQRAADGAQLVLGGRRIGRPRRRASRAARAWARRFSSPIRRRRSSISPFIQASAWSADLRAWPAVRDEYSSTTALAIAAALTGIGAVAIDVDDEGVEVAADLRGWRAARR